MQIQKSFETEQGGLYIVPTPIGNLEDMTFRAIKTLRSAAVIAAEDTRNTKRLLNHFEIATPLLSYHEHNKNEREHQLIARLQNGEMIALVSDAGMPAISDPGYELVKATIDEGLRVVVLPGANAALCALVGSGLPTDKFLFYGFLPRKQKEKAAVLNRLKQKSATLIFYESPYRVKETMKVIHTQLGDRKVTIARELTKRYEEYIRGQAEDVLKWVDEHELKGECCIIVGGEEERTSEAEKLWWSHLSVKDHVIHYIEQEQYSSKTAIKQVSDDRYLGRRDVYKHYHIL